MGGLALPFSVSLSAAAQCALAFFPANIFLPTMRALVVGGESPCREDPTDTAVRGGKVSGCLVASARGLLAARRNECRPTLSLVRRTSLLRTGARNRCESDEGCSEQESQPSHRGFVRLV